MPRFFGVQIVFFFGIQRSAKVVLTLGYKKFLGDTKTLLEIQKKIVWDTRNFFGIQETFFGIQETFFGIQETFFGIQ